MTDYNTMCPQCNLRWTRAADTKGWIDIVRCKPCELASGKISLAGSKGDTSKPKYRDRGGGRVSKSLLLQMGKTEYGFTMIEVMMAGAVALVIVLAMTFAITNVNNALAHFILRSEMINLLVTATVEGDACVSIRASGSGAFPLLPCGSIGTPDVIDILSTSGGHVDANSNWLLQGNCAGGTRHYELAIKNKLATRVDPFNKKDLGTTYLMPAIIRFGAQAFNAGGCP